MVGLKAYMKFCKGNHSKKMKTFRVMKLALEYYTKIIMFKKYM